MTIGMTLSITGTHLKGPSSEDNVLTSARELNKNTNLSVTNSHRADTTVTFTRETEEPSTTQRILYGTDDSLLGITLEMLHFSGCGGSSWHFIILEY